MKVCIQLLVLTVVYYSVILAIGYCNLWFTGHQLTGCPPTQPTKTKQKSEITRCRAGEFRCPGARWQRHRQQR